MPNPKGGRGCAAAPRPPPIHGRGTMSEPNESQETEPDVPGVADVPEPDQEPHEPIPDEAEEAAEADEQTPPEPAQPPVDAAKEQRRITAALEREHKAHDAKLEKILGAAHEDVLPCPLCGDGLQGYVFPGDGPNLPDEQKQQAMAFLQVGGPPQLNMVPGFHECELCNGYGELANPTKAPHFLTRTCYECQGNGFKADAQPASNVSPLVFDHTQPPPIPTNEVGPCPICGVPNTAGKPHFCNPATATGAGGV